VFRVHQRSLSHFDPIDKNLATPLFVKEDAVAHVPQLGEYAGGAGRVGHESEAIGGRCGPRHGRLTEDKLTCEPDTGITHVRAIGHRAAPANIEGDHRLHRHGVQESEERVGDVEEVEELQVRDGHGRLARAHLDGDGVAR